MKIRNTAVKYGSGLGLLAAAATSHAAIDTAAVTASIGEAGTAAAAVGAAVLVMIVGIKVFKWIRAAM
ncbi:MAG: major capsid protein [Azonexus sp.]|jgi:hypothetical protein|nr:major capsid protein [Azonexus sp.]